MKKSSKNKIKKVRGRWITISVLSLAVLFVIQAYLLPPGKVIGETLIKFLPLPAALVNADVITLGDYYDRVEIAERIGSVDAGNRTAILNQLIDNKIAELTAKNKNISISSKEIDQAYADLQRSTGKQDLGLSFGLSESQFKKEILTPDYIKTRLQIWLASNTKLNADVYKSLDEIKKKLLAGSSFDDMAAMYSDDSRSAKIGGDMGFLSYNDIVPEIYDQLGHFTDHDAHVLTSRFGVHIIEVVGKDNSGPMNSPRYHIKQIFLQTADYSKWFNNQKKLYTVLKLAH